MTKGKKENKKQNKSKCSTFHGK